MNFLQKPSQLYCKAVSVIRLVLRLRNMLNNVKMFLNSYVTYFSFMILGFTVTILVFLPTSLLTFPVVGGRLHLKFGRETIFKIQLIRKKCVYNTYTWLLSFYWRKSLLLRDPQNSSDFHLKLFKYWTLAWHVNNELYKNLINAFNID